MVSVEEKRLRVEARVARRVQLGRLSFAPVGVGNYATGNILLIGEQAANPNERTPEQQPFCSTRGCSGWLNWLLEEEGVPEDRLFWLNAKNNDGSWVDTAPILNMGASLIVVMGKVAHEYVIMHGINTALFPAVKFELQPHPQYWKRFKHKERYPLLDVLRENIFNLDGGLESSLRINNLVSTERCCPCHNSTAIIVIKDRHPWL